MKLSNDQKKIIKSFAIYPVCYIIGTILYHTIKGDVDWIDILWLSVCSIVLSILLAIFFVLGSKTPEK